MSGNTIAPKPKISKNTLRRLEASAVALLGAVSSEFNSGGTESTIQGDRDQDTDVLSNGLCRTEEFGNRPSQCAQLTPKIHRASWQLT